MLSSLFLVYEVVQYKMAPNINKMPISIEEKLFLLRNHQVRMLNSDEVRKFLLHHSVYVSLTTTPKRIKKIHKTLETLDLRNVDEILLAIPERYSKNNEPYDIPKSLVKQFPKLKILPLKDDLGPISKLIPAVEYAKSIDEEAIVITIDDDVAYPFSLVNELIYQTLTTNAVVGTIVDDNLSKDYSWSEQKQGFDISRFVHSKMFWKHLGLRKRDIVIGFGGMAYQVKMLDTDKMVKISQLGKPCFQSDDLVIVV